MTISRATLGRIHDVASSDRTAAPIPKLFGSGCIYIVEDHDLVRSLLSTWLSARGHLVEPCSPSHLSWMNALDRHDLVVLDLCLGDRDGVEILQTLADRGFRGDLILISAFPESVIATARAVAVDLGLRVLGTLRKPLALDRLDEILRARRSGEPPAARSGSGGPSLAEALATRRVTFHYQPILDARTLAPVSMEMLARLVDETGAEVSVIGALATAESEDLHDLARLALESVGDVAERLRSFGIVPPPVSINVPSHFLQRRHFDPIVALIKECPVPVTLEVSELDAFDDPSEARRVTTSAVLKGLRFSLDDFGTVNSNIDRFVQFPFDELKLDRTYVSGCTEDPVRDTVCRSAIELAHVRHATIVAEGVETFADLTRLRELGVDRVQGYLFSRHLTLAAFADWIRRNAAPVDPSGSVVDFVSHGETA
jgi:EAL domain-containing protein (putative c-di-GMP-specific phosphodiesterase class I)